MKSLPCAIYTRKSTDEGLEQDFNSLDAQRAACAAYITSQVGEGWVEVATRYDDGGYSGGSLERPGLQRLLADVQAGRIKVVVVYKVDRLTRSLTDFAKIVETLEAQGASFVSITQQFSTTTSMGRLTLNVLLSFAQFEREVTAERIRDKIAASKQKGLWMGGVVPLGYDVVERKLVVNEAEAATVRKIYDLYLQHANVRLVKQEADRLGLRTKRREGTAGPRQGGEPFLRGHLYQLLANPIYMGKLTHKGNSYPGEHEAIVAPETWERVQAQFRANATKRRNSTNAKAPSLLTGILETDDGHPLSPSHATKQGKRYRYYVTRPRDGAEPEVSKWSLPALALEKVVRDGLSEFLGNKQRIHAQLLPNVSVDAFRAVVKRAAVLVRELSDAEPNRQREILREILQRVIVSKTGIAIKLDGRSLAARLDTDGDSTSEEIVLDIPVAFRRRGVETKLIIDGANASADPDPKLIELMVSAHRWFNELKAGVSIREIAKRHGTDAGDVSRVLPLAFLAPDILEAILDGHQPPELTAARLKRMRDLPLEWPKQRNYLGLA
ncbi:MAG: recombinase family protein [Rhodovibrionaceae bacterium]